MLIPLLVRLTDSQIELADGVVSKSTDRLDDRSGVLEQVCPGRLLIDKEALPSNLHVNPIDGNIEPGGQLYGAEQGRFVGPPGALRRCPDAGCETEALHSNRQNLVVAVG